MLIRMLCDWYEWIEWNEWNERYEGYDWFDLVTIKTQTPRPINFNAM